MSESSIRATLCIILLTLSANISAQDNEQRIIEAIQQQYQKAVRWVEESQMSDETNNSMQIDIRQVTSGHTTRVKRYEFYYQPDTWNLYFVRLSYNKGRQRYNEEYMFDDKTQDLVYASLKHDIPNSSSKSECRCYFYNKELSHYTKAEIRSETGRANKDGDTDESTKWEQQSKANARDIQRVFKDLIDGH